MAELAQQSNPFSTGGGGVNFETRVQAAFTVLMLSGQSAPCLPSFPITKLKLQGRYEGYHTDDFIAFTQDYQSGEQAKLLAQIKHEIAITAGNETFSEVIASAWEDFSDDAFVVGKDAFALITGPLTSVDTKHVRPILEWARYSADEIEFFQKITSKGFSSKNKQDKLKAFRTHLTSANNNNELNDKQFWEFLKSFHIIGYDFDAATGSDLSLIKALITQCTKEPSDSIWGQLLNDVQATNQNAGTITRDTLSYEITQAFEAMNVSGWLFDERKLKAHSSTVLGRIQNTIGDVHIEQPDSLASLLGMIESSDFVIVTGERGSGKSSLVQTFVKKTPEDVPVFCFSTEDFNFSHLDQAFSSMNLKGSLNDLAARFALIPRKYLVLESLEKLLELEHITAFVDLLQFIKKSGNWKIVASCRDYAIQTVAFQYLTVHSVPYEMLRLQGFSDQELQKLCNALPAFTPLLINQNLKSLIKIPFFAWLAFKVLETGREFSENDGVQEFRLAVWRDVIANEQDRRNGLPTKRKRAFIDIAVQRAKKMVYGVPEDGFDSGAVYKLEEDNIIYRDTNRSLLIPAHDVLEDWALESYIDTAYQRNEDDVEQFVETVGKEPAISRSFRLWLSQKLNDQDDVDDFVYDILAHQSIPSYWKDETMSALLNDVNPTRFLDSLAGRLFENDSDLLKRFCFVLRVACQTPHPDFLPTKKSENNPVNALVLIPDGKGWKSIIHFLVKYKEQLSETMLPQIANLLNDWSLKLNVNKPLPEEARDVGLLALHLLEPLKNSYDDADEKNRSSLTSIILKTASAIRSEFIELFEKDVFIARSGRRIPRRSHYIEDFCAQVFSYAHCAHVVKYFPDLMIRLANYEWFVPEETNFEGDSRFRSFDGGMGTAKFFGIHDSSRHDFFPACGLKGPFRDLLNYHPLEGLKFILDMLNRAAEKYAHSDLDTNHSSHFDRLDYPEPQVEQLSINLNDGSTIDQYISGRLWLAYRGHSVAPYKLQCALMALENWLVITVENSKPETVGGLFEYILKHSNSVMTTAVLASVATGYPDKVGKAALPLLRHHQLYLFDLHRTVQEMGGSEVNWFRAGIPRKGVPIKLYEEDRRIAALRPWRQQNLEHVIQKFQFTEELRIDAFQVIDTIKTSAPSDEYIRFLLHRIDSRGWTAVAENNRIMFKPSQLENDLQEIQQNTESEKQINDRFTTLYLWSNKVLSKEKLEREYYTSWQEVLAEAKALLALVMSGEVDTNELSRYLRVGIIKAAAVFIRDFSSKLTDDDIEWCCGLVIPIFDSVDDENYTSAAEIFDSDGSAACANILPILFDYCSGDEDKNALKGVIVRALTHINDNVRYQASAGVRDYLWSRDADFAQICISGTIEYAYLYQQEIKDEYRGSYYSKDRETIRASLQTKKDEFRTSFVRSQISLTVPTISLDTHSAWHILSPCLMIPDGSRKAEHIELYSNMLAMFYASEQKDYSDRDDMHHLNFEVASKFTERFAKYLLPLHESNFRDYEEQLNEACEAAPSFLMSLMLRVAVEGENNQQETIYWKLWEKLNDTMRAMALDTAYQERSRYGRDEKRNLLRSLLKMDMPWRRVNEKVQLIELGKSQLLGFAQSAAMNPDVFEALSKLMYYFPNVFFDQGVHILAKYQKLESGLRLLSGTNTSFYVESSVQHFLQREQTGALPRKVHTSCFVLLDAIVKTGSAQAYSLREHLVRSRRIL